MGRSYQQKRRTRERIKAMLWELVQRACLQQLFPFNMYIYFGIRIVSKKSGADHPQLQRSMYSRGVCVFGGSMERFEIRATPAVATAA